MLMVPPTMFMDPLTLLEIEPPNVQDSATKYVHGSSTVTMCKIPPSCDHVCLTHQMIHGQQIMLIIFIVPPILFKVPFWANGRGRFDPFQNIQKTLLVF